MVSLFGFEFKRKQPDQPLPSFAPLETDDGALTIVPAGPQSYGTYVDLEGTVRTEAELVSRYREMSNHAEVDNAIDEITNGAVTKNDDGDVVKVFTDDLQGSYASVKKQIEQEFDNVLKLLNFDIKFHDIFRRWYIDGRLYYHVIIDEKDVRAGIKELRYVDPRKIRKVREVVKKRALPGDTQDTVVQQKNEYYVYNDRGFNYGSRVGGNSTTGLRIAKDAVVHITSGLTDTNGSTVLSFLHKAIKPLNQLRMLEDAVVIYRLSRAPERRLWYIDVGQLPKHKAEQYLRDIMVKHKNRLVYDASSGEIKDDRKFMTMLEDYWLPQREGRGTKVDTLPPGQNLGKMEDVEYFQKKLYISLGVPISRLNLDGEQDTFGMGRPSEITREELKFDKFIDRLRTRFAELFSSVLEKQLVLKGIVNIEEWKQIKENLDFEFIKDSIFTELKEQEVLLSRNAVQQAMMESGVIGMYVSNDTVRRNIWKQDDQEIKDENKKIAAEQDEFQFLPPEEKAAQRQMEQQAEMEQQQMEQQQAADAAANDPNSPEAQAAAEQDEYTQLKDKKNRSMQDEQRFKSLSQKIQQKKQAARR